jgi:hypothetical protein
MELRFINQTIKPEENILRNRIYIFIYIYYVYTLYMQGDRPGAAMTRICMQRAAATAHFCVHPAKIHYTGIITYACLF